jgi:hypothetical protein
MSSLTHFRVSSVKETGFISLLKTPLASAWGHNSPFQPYKPAKIGPKLILAVSFWEPYRVRHMLSSRCLFMSIFHIIRKFSCMRSGCCYVDVSARISGFFQLEYRSAFARHDWWRMTKGKKECKNFGAVRALGSGEKHLRLCDDGCFTKVRQAAEIQPCPSHSGGWMDITSHNRD